MRYLFGTTATPLMSSLPKNPRLALAALLRRQRSAADIASKTANTGGAAISTSKGAAVEFKSVDQALRWGYRTTSGPVVKLSGIYSMRGPAATNPDMSEMERRAQAAQIIAAVEALAGLECAYVQANYGRFMTAAGAELLRRHCRAALTPVRAERGIELILTSYLGHHVGWRAMGDALHCSQRDVPALRAAVFVVLDALHERVIQRLDQRFTDSGLIVPRETSPSA